MIETRMGVIAGVALTIMGAADFVCHQSGGATATALLVIEVVAIIVGVGAIFSWARIREKRNPSDR
jgi:Zn-dependent protease with chaperone function